MASKSARNECDVNFNLSSSNRSSPNTSQRENSSPSSSPTSTPSPSKTQLTQQQVQRMESNRKRALEIRRAKETGNKIAKLVVQSSEQKKMLDTGAGFFLDEEDLIEEKRKEANLVLDPPVPVPNELLVCARCRTRFAHSLLSLKFDISICDSCKIKYADDYKLITKTDAKEKYLLKDCDFDFREPVLKYMVKKNPHKTRSDMKLYLECQVKERALHVHESEENLAEKKEQKILNLHKTRQKNYEKKLQELRKEARQASKKVTQFHQHEYGEGIYNEEEDNYYKICKTCSHRLEYEEL